MLRGRIVDANGPACRNFSPRDNSVYLENMQSDSSSESGQIPVRSISHNASQPPLPEISRPRFFNRKPQQRPIPGGGRRRNGRHRGRRWRR